MARPVGYREHVGPWIVKRYVVEKLGMASKDVVVLDVGAYRGDYTAMLLRTWPDAKYFLFEPVPQAVVGTANRFADRPRVQVVPAAMSNNAREGVAFYTGGHRTEMSSLLPRNLKGRRYYRHPLGEQIEVDTFTIDEYVRTEGLQYRDVTLIKLDVQGAEKLVLEGAVKTLRYGKPPLIYTEVGFVPMYEGAAMFWEISQLLASHHYSLFDLYSLGRSKVSRQLKYGDALFIHDTVRKRVLDLLPEEWLPKSLAQAIGQ